MTTLRAGRWRTGGAWQAAIGALLALATGRAQAGSFVNFESGHVRPLALSPAGDMLFAVNTPDNRLAIYTVAPAGLALVAEVPVGLEPVAVAARTNAQGRTEAWVVNHLSDSVSIVELDAADVTKSRVRRTLLVGDEPRDIVFAGPGMARAFVTAAHRGQNRTTDPQLTMENVPRADVWVFDATSLGAALGGTPLVILSLQGDTPRALAVSSNGATVYAAVFMSGNQTTTIPEPSVSAGGGLPTFMKPGARHDGPPTGLIVQLNPVTGNWEDELWRDWSGKVPFTLPDKDVFVIDANATPPALAPGANAVSGVGTVLFNMAVRPGNGKLYVSNTEARNAIRFEPEVQGHIVDNRITVVSGGSATHVELNQNIKNYDAIPGPPAEKSQSLAIPMGMAFSPSGNILYVTAFGSAKIAALDADKLETGTTVPRTLVPVGGGPSGLVLDAANDRLYVMNRFDHTISLVTHASDTSKIAATGTVSLHYTPEPPDVRDGRPLLYDAVKSSAHGDSACASCHVFGDFDGLAWDLGNPFDMSTPANTNPFAAPALKPANPVFHPVKGPMTTQSLRGMADAGPMHWRGDKTGGGALALDTTLAFKQFKGAFQNLLGGDSPDMDAFARFVLTLRYPPNPVRNLDNSPTGAQLAGETFFRNTQIDLNVFECNFCHALPLGTAGLSSMEGEPQEFKIPHLRNLYAKIGRFGMPTGAAFGIPAHAAAGEQVRGFGFLHDGSVSTLDNFLHAMPFTFNDLTADRDNVAAFLLSVDTGLAPVVGQQVTLTPTSTADATVAARIDLLLARADAHDCDLVVKGIAAGMARGWLHAATTGTGRFRSDRSSEPLLADASLRALAATAGQELTYTAVPPGSGVRIGIDRDEDGSLDRDEIDAGTDPGFSPTTTSTSTSSSTSISTTSTTSTTVPLCEDKVRDGNESDVDCGGGCCCRFVFDPRACPVDFSACRAASCTPCVAGKYCYCDSDCTSGKCEIVFKGSLVTRACAPIKIFVPPVFDPWWWLKGPAVLVVGNAVYVPAKLGFAAIGGIASGVTYVATAGNGDAAQTVWSTAAGGDYVITPGMVERNAFPRFVGDVTGGETTR